MALSGTEKAALLLASVDSTIAVELLKGLPPEEVEKLSIELVRLDASGRRNSREQIETVKEFVASLQKENVQTTDIQGFLNETLVNVVGKDRAKQIQARAKEAIAREDPFVPVREAEPEQIALALDGEHPQTIAVVLGELPPKKSQKVLSLLNEQVRAETVCRMAAQDSIGPVVRQRIAATVASRLSNIKGRPSLDKSAMRRRVLRRVAVMLTGLEKELRDKLFDELKKRDKEVCATIKNLMVTWEDIPSIADRSVQEALRSVEAKTLAVALSGADQQIVDKIRQNISERAAASLDEEASLMQQPLPKEIEQAREQIIKPLRQANEEGKLRFVDR